MTTNPFFQSLKTSFVDPFKKSMATPTTSTSPFMTPPVAPTMSMPNMSMSTPKTPSMSYATPPTQNMSIAPNMSIARKTTPVAPRMNTPQGGDDNVRMQQIALNANGAGLKVDGILGRLTMEAIRARDSAVTKTPSGGVINPVTGGVTEPTPPTPPTPPVAPPVSPEQQAVTDAESAYKTAGVLSPEETATQKSLDTLQESFKTGFQNTEDQAIPIGFIRGQQASQEKRALNLAEPLQAKLARLQAQRTSSQGASKFALERADAALKSEKDKSKPGYGLIEGTSFYDPVTKTFQSAPVKAKADDGFSLSPGQTRYDAQGNPIAALVGDAFSLSEGQIRYDSQGNPIASVPKGDTLATAAKKGKAAADVTSVIDQLLASDTGAISGIPSLGAFIPGTMAQKTKNLYNQLKGMLSLQNRTLLQGSGAISDFEARTLERAASALGRNLSDADFISTLNQLKTDLAKGDPSANTGGNVVQTKAGPINTNW